MTFDFSHLMPNGTGRVISPLTSVLSEKQEAGAVDKRAAEMETFVLEADRAAVALVGLVPMIDVQDDAVPLATAVRGMARALRSQVSLAFDLQPSGLRLTDRQRERLEEVRDDLSELIDTLNWTIDGSEGLSSLIRSECA